MSQELVAFLVRIPRSLRASLKSLAARRELTMTAAATTVLTEYVDASDATAGRE